MHITNRILQTTQESLKIATYELKKALHKRTKYGALILMGDLKFLNVNALKTSCSQG